MSGREREVDRFLSQKGQAFYQLKGSDSGDHVFQQNIVDQQGEEKGGNSGQTCSSGLRKDQEKESQKDPDHPRIAKRSDSMKNRCQNISQIILYIEQHPLFPFQKAFHAIFLP